MWTVGIETEGKAYEMTSKRNLAAILGGIAAVALFMIVNPWFAVDPKSTADQVATVTFWVSFIALLVVLFEMRKEPGGETVEIEGPAFTRFLFGNTRAGLFWLPIRLFVGFTWLEAGYHKFSGTGWMDGGSALQGYWQHAVAVPAAGAGSPAITYDWYRTFLQTLLDNNAYTWFAPLIAFGEMAVGIGLLVGCLTGVAAFFGAMMNMSFLLAGSASVNPVLFTLAIGLILGLEGRRLLRRRSLPPPDARHAVASRSREGTRHEASRRRSARLVRRVRPLERNPRPRVVRPGRSILRGPPMARPPGWPSIDAVVRWLYPVDAIQRRMHIAVRTLEGRGTKMTNRRNLAAILGGIAAVALFMIVNPWFAVDPKSTADQVATVTFWVSFIALLVVLFEMRKEPGGETVEIEGPAFTRFLFGNTRAGLFWLPIRLFVGFTWLEAGYHKFSGTGWMDGGSALQGYWQHAVAVPAAGAGSPAITYDWYRTFLQTLLDNNAYTWFAPLIAFGEMAVGIGLLVGCLTGVAAFFGAMMNMSFLLAGSASVNPVLFTLAIGLILGWKVAGYYGVDRYLLPMLGTPWRPGAVKGREAGAAGASPG